MAAAALTPDAQEGIAAFLEKRPPRFRVDDRRGLPRPAPRRQGDGLVRDDTDLDGDFDGIDAQPLHERIYRVRAYRNEDGTILLRGAVRDQKPAGLFFPDDDGPDHRAPHGGRRGHGPDHVRHHVGRTSCMETHPHDVCRVVEPHYDKLVGLSIARGFSAKVRELFGGPRGCTHTTALLLAMAPVAVQSMFSMQSPPGADGAPAGGRAAAHVGRAAARGP